LVYEQSAKLGGKVSDSAAFLSDRCSPGALCAEAEPHQYRARCQRRIAGSDSGIVAWALMVEELAYGDCAIANQVGGISFPYVAKLLLRLPITNFPHQCYYCCHNGGFATQAIGKHA